MSDTLASMVGTFVAQLRARFPAAAKQLRKPLAADDIRRLAVDEHLDFPRSLYPLFQSANGQRSTRQLLLPSVDRRVPGYALYPADLVFSRHNATLGSALLYAPGMFGENRNITADEEALRAHWNERWFAFAEWEDERNARYACLYVDLAAAPEASDGRVVAQLTTAVNFRETVIRQVVAPSLQEFFLRLVADIEAGTINYDERGSIIPVGAASPVEAAVPAKTRSGRRNQRTMKLSIGDATVGFSLDRERDATRAQVDARTFPSFVSGFAVSSDRNTPIDVVLEPPAAESPEALAESTVYQGAADWFLQNQIAVRDAVLARLMDYIAHLRDDVGIEDETLAEVADAIDLGSLLVPTVLRLFPQSRDGRPYLGIEFDCEWDPEHGCGVLVHGTRAIEAGMADVAQAGFMIDADGGAVVPGVGLEPT